MHNTIDYTKRLTPRFDAVEDIKEWLGKKKWDEVSPAMSQIKNVDQFCLLAGLAGVQGFPVECWYDLYQGEGAYKKACQALEEREPIIKAALWSVSQNHDGD